jgi:hypothetical protein
MPQLGTTSIARKTGLLHWMQEEQLAHPRFALKLTCVKPCSASRFGWLP